MTAPAIETTTVTLEDIAPPCGWYTCDQTAEWVTGWSCSCVYFYCDPHKEYMMTCTNVKCLRKHGGMHVTMATMERL